MIGFFFQWTNLISIVVLRISIVGLHNRIVLCITIFLSLYFHEKNGWLLFENNFFSLETFGKYRLLGKAFEDFVIGLLILLDPNTIAGFGVDKALLF